MLDESSQPTQSQATGRSERRSRSLVKQNRWALDEENSVLDALARDMSEREMHETRFRHRTWEGVRKKVREMRASRGAQIQIKREALQQRAAAAAIFKDDDALFVKAVRNSWDWRRLHETRFQHKSEDSVKLHFVEVRQRVAAEDKAKADAARTQTRYLQQIESGEPSTGPSQKFTSEEDDLLLAARIEQAEMKRVAMHYFPLRSYENVRSRASNLHHNADRAAQKSTQSLCQSSNLSQTDRILDFLDEQQRERIEAKREQIRADEKIFSIDRNKESEQKALQKRKASEEKARNDEKRLKMRQSLDNLTALEEANKKQTEIEQRRLAEDVRNNAAYSNEYAAWYARSEADRAAGRSIQPSPKRPKGSSIGTEVLVLPRAPMLPPMTSTATPRASGQRQSGQPEQTEAAVQDGSLPSRPAVIALGEIQATQAAASSKRRQTLNPYVEIVLPTKKQRTDRDRSAALSPPTASNAKSSSSKAQQATGADTKAPSSSIKRKSSFNVPTPSKASPLSKSTAKTPVSTPAPVTGRSQPAASAQKHDTRSVRSSNNDDASAAVPAAPNPQDITTSTTQESKVQPSPFKSRLASQKGEPCNIAASQPVSGASMDGKQAMRPSSGSSSSYVPPEERFVNILKVKGKDRQSTLNFQVAPSQPRLSALIAGTKDLPTPESRERGPPMFDLTSSNESVFSDEDINDDELTAAVENSSGFWQISAARRTSSSEIKATQETNGAKPSAALASSPPAIAGASKQRSPVTTKQARKPERIIPDTFEVDSQLLHETEHAVHRSPVFKGMSYSKMAAAAGCGLGSLPKDKYGNPILPDQHESVRQSASASPSIAPGEMVTPHAQRPKMAMSQGLSKKATPPSGQVQIQMERANEVERVEKGIPLSQATSKANLVSIRETSQESLAFQTQDPSTFLSQRLWRRKQEAPSRKPTQPQPSDDDHNDVHSRLRTTQLSKTSTAIPISQQTTQGEIEGSIQGTGYPTRPENTTARRLRHMVAEMDDIHGDIASMLDSHKESQGQSQDPTAQSMLPDSDGRASSVGKGFAPTPNHEEQSDSAAGNEEGVEEIDDYYRSESDDYDSDDSVTSSVRRRELRARLPESMTEGEKDRAVAGPPRLSAAEKEAALSRMNHLSQVSMNSIRTADLAPPFPSSGRVRSLTPTPPPEKRQVQSSPAVRNVVTSSTRQRQPLANGATANTSSSRASLSRPPPSTAPPMASAPKSTKPVPGLAKETKNPIRYTPTASSANKDKQPKAATATPSSSKNPRGSMPKKSPQTTAELQAELKRQHEKRGKRAEAELAQEEAKRRLAAKERKKERKRRAKEAEAAKKARVARKASGEDVSSSSEDDSDEGNDPIEDLGRQAREYAVRNGASQPYWNA